MLLLAIPGLRVGTMLDWRIGGVRRNGLGINKPAGGDGLVAGRVKVGSLDSERLYALQIMKTFKWSHRNSL